MIENKEYLRIKGACKFIGIAKSTFWLWVRQEKLPKGILLSPRCRVWEKGDLIKFIESHKQGE